MPSPACMRQSEVTAVDHGIGQVNLLRSVLVLHRKGDRKAGGQKHIAAYIQKQQLCISTRLRYLSTLFSSVLQHLA